LDPVEECIPSLLVVDENELLKSKELRDEFPFFVFFLGVLRGRFLLGRELDLGLGGFILMWGVCFCGGISFGGVGNL
jgi:hypothetical protein